MRPIYILIILLINSNILAQETQINTEIRAENIFELSIIQVYPDSFPQVSVVFQAKNNQGKPLWELDKSEISVQENDQFCEVIRLRNISKNKPLNIGLVFDHSGSMVDNPAQMADSIETMQDYYFMGKLPLGYIMSIEYAKKGILAFLNETNFSSDSLLFVSFSSEVDKVISLSNNPQKIKETLALTEPAGATAYYDALYVAIDSLKRNKISSRVIVSLTDGQDNQSKHTYHDVIEHANANDIAIFIIGLGNVQESTLRDIATRTNGFYYHTNQPETLTQIYLNIKEQLRSIYQLDYKSELNGYVDEEQFLRFNFLNDTLTFSNPEERFILPDEVVAHLKDQEDIRLRDIRDNVLLIGGLAVLIGFSGFLIYRRREKKSLIINNVFPNPFNERLTLDYQIYGKHTNCRVLLKDLNGTTQHNMDISSESNKIILETEKMNYGIYLIQIESDTNISKAVKLIKK